MTRRPPRRRAAALLALLAVAAVPVAWASSAEGVAAPAEVFGGGGTLTAGAAELSGLTYGGTLTVSTSAGDTQVLELTSSAAALTDLALHVACTPVPGLGTGLRLDAATTAGSTSTAASGLTLYATSVTAATGAGPVAWTPASPPPAAQLGDVSLTGLVVDFAGIEAPALSAPGLAEATSFCTA